MILVKNWHFLLRFFSFQKAKIYTTRKLILQDMNTTPKEPQRERDCGHRQLFRYYYIHMIQPLFIHDINSKLQACGVERQKLQINVKSY